LGRPLDPAGQAYWLAQLQAGTPCATVATSLLSSTEYRRNLVASYYSTYLGRTASSTESAGAVNALANGLRDESLINVFVSSLEYFQGTTLGGDTNKTWLTSLYQKILNRAPDTAGLNGALNALLNDYAVQRQTEVTSLSGSKEYRTDVVNGLYQKYLLRAADAGALAFWVPALQAGTATDEQLIASLVGTQEYFTKHGGTNLSFLQAAYLDILGRPLDSSGQAYWLGQLQAGASRTTVATTLLSSLEYRSNLVSGFYTTYLGRSGSSGDIAYWAGQLGLGVPDEQVIDYLLTSNEYFLRAHTYP
jgi:hypothetical protein